MTQSKQGMPAKIMSGLFWTAGGKGAQAILQFVVMVILARLMSPLEFGVVSGAMIVVGFSEIITRLGLGPALVQRDKLEPRHLSTAFFVSLLFSFAVGALVWLLAAPVAVFFDFGAIEPVLRVLAWLFPIRGFGIVAESLVQRELRFKWLANTETVAFILGYFVLGIGLALSGYGVWSLVAANLAAAAAKTVALLIAYPPKKFVPERRAFQELIYFGGGFTLARFANYLALQGDNLVVGRFLGLSALGLYGRAYQLMSVPASLFGQVLDDVLFPSMAKMQHDRDWLAAIYLRGISLIALVMLPASVVVTILAPEIIQTLLGAQWTEVVLPFRILTAGLLLRTSYKMSDSLARATGSVYRRAWRQAIYAAAVITGAWVGQFWGIAGVAVGVFAALAVNFLLMAQMSLKLVEKTWANFINAHANASLLAASTALITVPTVEILRRINSPPLLLLIVTTIILSAYLLLIIQFAPHRFLGSEGLWMLKILKNYVPDKLINKIPFGKKSTRAAEKLESAAAVAVAAENVGASG